MWGVRPSDCGEGEEAGEEERTASCFRWQELKREDRKNGRIGQTTEEILKDFSSVCPRKSAWRPTFATHFSCLPA